MQTGSAWNFHFPILVGGVQQVTQLLLQNQRPVILILLLPSFLIDHVNSQIRINKMTNKHSFNYHPSISLELTSRTYPHISLDSLGLNLSPEILL